MPKTLFANEKVMKHYLDALLQEDSVSELTTKPVENLLSDVEIKAAEHKKASAEVRVEKAVKVPAAKIVQQPVAKVKPEPKLIKEKASPLTKLPQFDNLDDDFQALYFEVAGLTLAVPLNSLGGIYQLNEINHIIGKPDWFKGVMLQRDEKFNVVDTARWVMPEKHNKKLEEALNYQYLIVLGNSRWGFMAERLVDNVSLTHKDIKWREKRAKRPWLAGLIKDKMCALIDVAATKVLLDKGFDSKHDNQ